MTPLGVAVNFFGWPVIQVGLTSGFLRLAPNRFSKDTWLTAPRSWERNGHFYLEFFAIRSWKRMLPDGAPWFGGFAKKDLRGHQTAYLSRFLVETRRAELAHWTMLGCLPIFFLWNPPWACGVMSAYALATNLPCILVQRYNRIVLARVVATRGRSLAHL